MEDQQRLDSQNSPDVFVRFGFPHIINARGTVTRLSGSRLSKHTIAAMCEVCDKPVSIEDLQRAACRTISTLCATQAALVTCGAAAGLMLGAAAMLARWDLSKMEKLPDTADMPNEFIIARAHRNGYDHAIRAAGGKLVEVGMDEIRAGAGVRRTEAWEYEVAITHRCVGIVYVLTRDSRPPLAEVVAMAHSRNLPVLVDAAAQLPPVANLHAIVGTGADLVCFSGGKAIGGPQATGILCGGRDLVGSAFLQMMDQDEHPQHWSPPPEFINAGMIPGAPRHGIGRMLKVGKEQIVGLLAALEQFTESQVKDRIALRLNWLAELRDSLVKQGIASVLEANPRPMLKIPINQPYPHTSAMEVCRQLSIGSPTIYVNHAFLADGVIAVDPACLAQDELSILANRITEALTRGAG